MRFSILLSGLLFIQLSVAWGQAYQIKVKLFHEKKPVFNGQIIEADGPKDITAKVVKDTARQVSFSCKKIEAVLTRGQLPIRKVISTNTNEIGLGKLLTIASKGDIVVLYLKKLTAINGENKKMKVRDDPGFIMFPVQ
ncbi:hypothetical protein AAG747_12185 [Rapidithrix thailandica]|uniref:Uncharacterized protein n=1 Tax=Rapidithrix thailandica TaxID=413964 RepID=A0AAW9S8I7_9BACT